MPSLYVVFCYLKVPVASPLMDNPRNLYVSSDTITGYFALIVSNDASGFGVWSYGSNEFIAFIAAKSNLTTDYRYTPSTFIRLFSNYMLYVLYVLLTGESNA